MLETKLFELRDRGTFISAIGTLMNPGQTGTLRESRLLGAAGFSPFQRLVLFGRTDAEGSPFCYDPFAWGPRDRTWHVAHLYVQEHWDELESGALIDVEWILGERPEPKESDL